MAWALCACSMLLCSLALAQQPSGKARGARQQASPTSSQPRTPRSVAAAADGKRRLSDRAELDRVIELYMAGNYEECSSTLESRLSGPEGDQFRDPDVIERGRLYQATCALLLGRQEEARESLSLALQNNPLMQSPDSLTFPPPLVSLFLEVRDEMQQLIAEREREQVAQLRKENERARRKAQERLRREQELEKLAQEERVVAKNSRFIAAIPFGAGQFQNNDVALGAAFLASEAALSVTALTSGIILRVLVAQERKLGCSNELCSQAYNRQTSAAHTTLTVSTWGLLGVAVLGIAEAQWSFEKERDLGVRPRPLPKHLRAPAPGERRESRRAIEQLVPIVRVGPDGGFLGLSGRF